MDEKMIKNNSASDDKINWSSQTLTALRAFLVFAVALGLIYPLGITAVAQLTMPEKANGSLIKIDNNVVGSTRIAQKFAGDEYFHSRPSAVDYDASASGGSNFGPTNKKLISSVSQRISAVKNSDLKSDTNVNIPSDLVTASASGLDPNISLENAKIQSKRVAKKRNLTENELEEIINQNIDPDFIGIWGQESVNVLKLNMTLDRSSI